MRLLLVEDERSPASALGDALRDDGWVVDHTVDGREGLRLALQGHYDAIVLDFMLPTMNGDDVLRNLRAGKVWAPVLMLTAKDGDYDQTDAFELGADDYVTRPFSTPVLLARLQALARRGAPERPVALTTGGLIDAPFRTRSLETVRPRLPPQSGTATAGILTTKRHQPSGASSATTVPPWARTISETIASPRPVPPVSLVRESSRRTNRSKMR